MGGFWGLQEGGELPLSVRTMLGKLCNQSRAAGVRWECGQKGSTPGKQQQEPCGERWQVGLEAETGWAEVVSFWKINGRLGWGPGGGVVVGGTGEWFGGRGQESTKDTVASRPVPEGEGGRRRNLLNLRQRNLDLIKPEELLSTVDSFIPHMFLEPSCTASSVRHQGCPRKQVRESYTTVDSLAGRWTAR